MNNYGITVHPLLRTLNVLRECLMGNEITAVQRSSTGDAQEHDDVSGQHKGQTGGRHGAGHQQGWSHHPSAPSVYLAQKPSRKVPGRQHLSTFLHWKLFDNTSHLLKEELGFVNSHAEDILIIMNQIGRLLFSEEKISNAWQEIFWGPWAPEKAPHQIFPGLLTFQNAHIWNKPVTEGQIRYDSSSVRFLEQSSS